MTLIQQQRLLGAVLLLCLIGVIAWFLLDTVERNQPQPQQEAPIAFDSVIEPIEEKVEPLEEVLVDPEQLGEVPAEIPDPLQPGTEQLAEIEPETEPAPAPAPQSQQENKPQSPASATDSTAQPQWVLQLASFSKKQNADALNAQLEQLGYDPMIETVNSAGTLIYRVRLKPVSDRNKLEQTAKVLSDKLKLNPQILQHQP